MATPTQSIPRYLPRAARPTSGLERLRALYPSADQATVVSVIAPAGYGKTTMVLDWVSSSQRPAMWLSLDGRHDDPVVLAGDIALAILAAVPEAAGLEEATAAPMASIWSTLMPRIAAACGQMRACLLVLDDVHELTSSESLDIVDWLAVHVAPGSQLIVVGRSSAGLALPRLRVDGSLVEIGVDDLRLTDKEAAAALRSAGRDLPDERVAQLNLGCEGWISGLLMSAAEDDSNGTRGGAREHADIVGDYVRSEVMTAMAEDDVGFLLDTSVLRELTGPLCDAVLESSASADRLEHLVDHNLFVVRLGGGRYHCHELFREALLSQATRRDSRRVSMLRGRAARWYAQAGQAIEAVRYAQESGDSRLTSRLISDSILPVFNAGRGTTIRGWLDWAETEPSARGDSRLVLGAAIVFALSGEADRAERWASLLDRIWAESADRKDRLEVEASACVLDAFFCRSGAEHALASARRAVGLLPRDDFWRQAAMGVMGLCQLANGLDDEAAETFAEVTHPSHDHEPGANVRAICLTLLARTHLESQELEAARAMMDRVFRIREQAGISGQALQAITDAVAARMALVADGDAVAARGLLVHAQTVRPLLTTSLPLVSLLTRLELTRAHLAIGDVAGARLLMREVADLLHARPDLGTFVAEAAALRVVVAEQLETAVGPSTLTVAELRLLPWLATHLSFREIGDRLFVSPTTVKTQALSIYRKLDASSRSEAVMAAVHVGLMDPAALPSVLRRDIEGSGVSPVRDDAGSRR